MNSPRWQLRWIAVVQGAALVLFTFATIIYFAQNFQDQLRLRRAQEANRILAEKIERSADEELKRLDNARIANEQMLKQLTAALNAHPNQSQRELALLQREVAGLHTELSTVRNGVDTLNAALSTNPEKALTLPLLKKDVDDLRTASQRDLDSLRGEMTRSYDLNKWLIGLILAGVVGTIIANALQARGSNRSEQPKVE